MAWGNGWSTPARATMVGLVLLGLADRAAPHHPLLVFVPGGFWGEPDERFRLPDTALEALTEHGLTVAVVHARAAPEHRHPAQAQDVAAAVGWLLDHAQQYDYSSKHVFLAGHSSGAQLAALVALDPRYLEAQGHSPSKLTGVITISGILDVSDCGIGSQAQRELYPRAFDSADATRRAASPVRHIHGDAPPFLVLSAAEDLPGIAVASRRFTERLRKTGNGDAFHHPINHNTHLSMIDFAGTSGAALRYLWRLPASTRQ